MSIHLLPPSSVVRLGDVVNLSLVCENPGTLFLTSSDPLVATVPASLAIAGTRTWRNGLKHGQYLARANCLQQRETATWMIEIDSNDIIPGASTAANSQLLFYRLLKNWNSENERRINWEIVFSAGLSFTLFFVYFKQCQTSAVNEVTYISSTKNLSAAIPGKIRIIVVVDAATYTIYINDGVTHSGSAARLDPDGTMGGTEICTASFPMRWAKWDVSDLTQAQRVTFMTDGTFAAASAAAFEGGHEIVPTAPVFWDTSGNNLDFATARPTVYHPPAAASGDYTDSPAVVPVSTYNLIALSEGTINIVGRRRRLGVPDRASDAEKWEESDPLTITVLPALASEQSNVPLMIYSDVGGTANITTAPAGIVSFVTPIVVPAGKTQVNGTIIAEGDTTVSVEINGVTSTTEVHIDKIQMSLSIGPDIDCGAESFPLTKHLKIYSNFDAVIDLVSDNADIHVPATATIVDGIAEIDVIFDTESSGTITATNDYAMSAVANVEAYFNPFLVKIGPAQTVLRGDRDLTVYLIVVSDTPGTVTLVSSDANFEVPASVVIGDDLYAVIECTAVGGCVATVTASKGIRAGTCVVTVTQSAEASPVPSRGTSRSVVAGEERAPFNINRESLPTLEHIDYAVFDWLNQMDIFVECSPEMGGFKKVPVMWVGTERSFQTKVYKDFRDLSGSLNPPFIAVQRKGFNKDLNDKGEHWLNTPVFYDFMQGVLPIKKQIRHDKTSQFINNSSKRKNGMMNYKFEEDEIKPVYETLYVPIPVYVSMNYEISIWTSYRTHMNTIQQKLITYVPAGNFNKVVLPHGGHNFEGFLDGDVTEDGNLEALEKEERKLTATFKLKVLGHVAGEEKNINSPEVSRRETAAKLTFDVENIEK